MDVSDSFDLITKFYDLNLGPRSIVQLVIQAHGSPTVIEIGRDRVEIGSELWDQFLGFFVHGVPPLLIATGSIFLHACSVGRAPDGNGVARRLSIAVKGHVVFGANGDVSMGDLEVADSQFAAVSYQVVADRARRDYSVVSYLNGEVFDEKKSLKDLVKVEQSVKSKAKKGICV